jgi:hypothetical protein
MNIAVGPFNLYFLVIVQIILYVTCLYLIIKNNLGLIPVLIMFFFPFIGSITIILYSIFNSNKDKLKVR